MVSSKNKAEKKEEPTAEFVKRMNKSASKHNGKRVRFAWKKRR